MDSNIVLICVAYICFVNVCIGLYVGSFGFDGFARPRPIALLIMLFGTLGALLLVYAQEKYGFKAQPKHIGASLVLFMIAFIVGRRFRSNKSTTLTKPHHNKVEMNHYDTITAKAEKAGILWRQGSYSGARRLYEDVLSVTTMPLDKAKILANIAQIYEKEGSLAEAVAIAEDAVKVINMHKLYESLEGSHLRGYLNGFLNRLKGRSRWAPLEYDNSIPLEMNLSTLDRFRVHLSLAVIAAGLSGTIGSQVPILRLDIAWPNGSIIIYSIVGFVFGWAVTSKLLQQAVISLCILMNKSIQASLKLSVNLLTGIAIIYISMMPFLLIDLLKKVVWFVFSGGLGAAFFFIFLFHRHAKQID